MPRSWEAVRPKAVDDEFLQHVDEGCQPLGLPSYVEDFVYSLGLFEILDDVLAMTHNLHEDDGEHGDRGRKSTLRLVDTLSLNSRLEELVESMPDCLKLSMHHEDVPAQTMDMFYVQAQVLHRRFVQHHIQKDHVG